MTAVRGTAPVFVVEGYPRLYVYVGQALYLDDDGRTVEHDHMRMAPVGGGDEVWVDPLDVTMRVDTIPPVPATVSDPAVAL